MTYIQINRLVNLAAPSAIAQRGNLPGVRGVATQELGLKKKTDGR
jgi:hypothetical protein